MKAATRAQRRITKGARFFPLLLVLVRLLVALTAVQMSGIPHVVADVMMAQRGDVGEQHLTDDCPNEKDRGECPPGCPDCHCAHPMSALPVLASTTFLLLPSFDDIAFPPYDALAPPRGELDGVYRPPRHSRA